MDYINKNWFSNEFSNINFNDFRIKERFFTTGEMVSKKPSLSIFAACDSMKFAKGAYRLFSNKKFKKEIILNAHIIQTVKRCQNEKIILAIQDTTFFDYGEHKSKEGMGAIANKKNYHKTGLLSHTTLAVTTKGVSLGLLDQMLWARTERDQKEVLGNKKEHIKWFRGTKNSANVLKNSGVEKIVAVCDRESSIDEWMRYTLTQGMNFLIRSRSNRKAESDGKMRKIVRKMMELHSSGEYEVEVKNTNPDKNKNAVKYKYRTAKVEVRFAPVYIPEKKKHPEYTETEPSEMNLYAIYVIEKDPPKEVEAVEWLLMTDIEIKTHVQAIEKIEWYKLRWHIESFHKIQKSGCRIEDCLLETKEKIEKFITMMSVIAWRLYWSMHIARTKPEENCEVALTESEWKVLYMVINKTKKLPKIPPTIYIAMRWVAQLGGFKGRKGDGEPGIQTTWIGWQRLQDFNTVYGVLNNDLQ